MKKYFIFSEFVLLLVCLEYRSIYHKESFGAIFLGPPVY